MSPDGKTLSKFDYTYDAVGNILTWQQQADSDPAVMWNYDYDAADQLTRAVKKSTGGTPTVLKRYAYGYDPAGNRTFEQIDDEVTGWSHDSLNLVVTQFGRGSLRFAGTVSEPATVTVQGQPAVVSGANVFERAVSLATGTTTVTIAATDPSGNMATADYEIDVAANGKSFTYDANGNLISDGTRTFEWDARNQLIAINVGTQRSESVYDGLQRHVRLVEKKSGVTQSEKHTLWCGSEVCEERAPDQTTVMRRAFAHGEQVATVARGFTRDPLGSVTDVTDASGMLLARYTFDSWGRRTVAAGTDVTDTGFTGHLRQDSGDLWLTLYRAYDPNLGRWIVADPMGMADGLNLYAYVHNRALVRTDRLGLAAGGWGMGGSYAAGAFFAAGGSANCQLVFDSGAWGVLCCAQGGGGYGIGAAAGIDVAVSVCPNCDSICDLAGWYVGVNATAGNFGGGGSASSGGVVVQGVVSAKAAGEVIVGLGVAGKSQLVYSSRNCDQCSK